MAVKLLKQNDVNKMECTKAKEKLKVYDERCRGLILEVRPSGTKTFFVKYKGKRDKYKQLKLGRASYLSVDPCPYLILCPGPNSGRKGL